MRKKIIGYTAYGITSEVIENTNEFSDAEFLTLLVRIFDWGCERRNMDYKESLKAFIQIAETIYRNEELSA